MDVGDGSDGTCDVLGVATTQITAARKYYQCTTLDINADLDLSGVGGAPLIIKVQNGAKVSATFTLDLSGKNGVSGSGAAGIVLGGAAGAGGGAGGNSQGLSLNGLVGAGTGGGGGGLNVPPFAADSTGGGGAGGTYQTQGAPLALEGEDGSPGGGAPGSSGVSAAIFGFEINFDTLFSGGSGGGAGGGGKVTNADRSGSSGGGGGGALRIIAGGDIDIDGTILCDGGNGGGTNGVGIAGGGGGSGGGIWLQSAGTLSVAGIISAIGGVEGTNFNQGFFGDGGHGGDGRIRLDDSNGAVIPTGSVTPAAYNGTFVPTAITTNSVSRLYSSTVACGRVSEENIEKQLPNMMLNLFLGFLFCSFIYYFRPKEKKYS